MLYDQQNTSLSIQFQGEKNANKYLQYKLN